MALKRDPWSGPVVQAVERIHQIRREMHQLELEEGVLREAVLTALEGVSEDEFPVRLGSHDVRVQFRNGRLDETAAYARLSTLGLIGELALVAEIVDQPAVATWEDTLKQVSMSVTSRQRLTQAFHAAISYRAKVDIEQLKRWREAKRLSEADYRLCFRDGRSVVRALTIR